MLCALFFGLGWVSYSWHMRGGKDTYEQSLWIRTCEEDCVDLHTTDCSVECRAQYREHFLELTRDNSTPPTSSSGKR
jgi:hypothetical protein